MNASASTSSVTAPPCHLPLIGEGLGACKYRKFSRKKVQSDKSRLHLLLTANIQRQLVANPIPPYQAARIKTYVG